MQGGLLPASDWDSLDRDWLSPVSRGSLLPDFALEGPVDVYLSQPTALQVCRTSVPALHDSTAGSAVWLMSPAQPPHRTTRR